MCVSHSSLVCIIAKVKENQIIMAFVPSTPVSARAFYGKSVMSAPAREERACPSSSSSSSSRAVPRMAAASDADVPDLAKRRTMNLLLGGTVGGVALGMLYPFTYFFVPRSAGNAGEGLVAKDALGNNIKKQEYLNTHYARSRELVQGLKGDATYLIVNDDKSDLEFYALNAVCTHLGCVVPWVQAENKFKCPCHGSQYDATGAVTRGPAPLPLALEHVEVDEEGNVVLKSWKEEDFRTHEAPWWNF